jgi:hypothetical protein
MECMTEGIETKRISYTPAMDRARKLKRVEATFNMPTPAEEGKLVTRVECGNLVAKVYQHADHPNFGYTVTFEREFLEDGKLKSSPRLTAGDMGALRHLTKEVHRAMYGGREDPAEQRMDDDEWQRREGRRRHTIPTRRR